jgi:hypothetical protein
LVSLIDLVELRISRLSLLPLAAWVRRTLKAQRLSTAFVSTKMIAANRRQSSIRGMNGYGMAACGGLC